MTGVWRLFAHMPDTRSGTSASAVPLSAHCAS